VPQRDGVGVALSRIKWDKAIPLLPLTRAGCDAVGSQLSRSAEFAADVAVGVHAEIDAVKGATMGGESC
jgi:hypothetical protein